MPEKKIDKNASDAISSLNDELEKLSKHNSAIGRDYCVELVILALKNDAVQKAFVGHILSSESFSRAYCLDSLVPEEERIVFEFMCVSPKVCLFPMRFLVNINFISGEIIKIEDPAPDPIHVGPAFPGAIYNF